MSRKLNEELEDETLPIFVETEQSEEDFLEVAAPPSSPEEPVPDNGSKDEPQETAIEAVPSQHITIVYRGAADVVSFGPYTFRPGVPARMPSNVAEELLTLPHEKFEVKE